MIPGLNRKLPVGGILEAESVDPHEPVKRFLEEHADLFGHGSDVLTNARIRREFVGEHNGMRTVVWEQQLDGIPVFQAVFIAHITHGGELVNVSSLMLPDPEQAAQMTQGERAALASAPAISASQAVANAAESIGDTLKVDDLTAVGPPADAPDQLMEFSAPSLSETARAQLVWLPMSRTQLRLCWKIYVTSTQPNESFCIVVDAETGEDVVRQGLTDHATTATYKVFASDSPTPRSPGWAAPETTQPGYASRAATPANGWLSQDCSVTIGNNVDAHIGAPLGQPDVVYGGQALRPIAVCPGNIFDYLPADPNALATMQPAQYQLGAVVQLFYWCNWMHDRLYGFGFTEAAGNFQLQHLTQPPPLGAGDPVLADAQDAEQFNDAEMTTLPDGMSPRMKMYRFTGPEPDRDADLDAEVILHEYTHGLSERRVAGGSVPLTYLQSVGLGEGWSDFMALALLSEPGDVVAGMSDTYAWGAYIAKDRVPSLANYYFGLRRYPYSTDLNKNPLTFKDIDDSQANPHSGIPRSPFPPTAAWVRHNQGEVWCSALWEARANLIETYDFPIGNPLMLQLVVDGMNLAPPNPTFVEARDAILQADLVNNAGENLGDIWAAFAKRGMGYSAVAPDHPESNFGVIEAYDLPTPGGEVWSYIAGGPIYSSPAVGSDGTIYFGAYDGKLYAVDRAGLPKWVFAPGDYFVYSSPAIGPDGVIYYGGSAISSPIGRLHAVNPDGTLKWSYPAGSWIYSSPAVGPDGAIYFGCMDGKLYALNSDGTLRWTRQTGTYIGSSPAIGKDGVIYVGSGGDFKLYAINPDSTVRWSRSVGGTTYGAPAIWTSPGLSPTEGAVYVTSSAGIHSFTADLASTHIRTAPWA